LLLAALLTLGVVLAPATAAFAHPLGNFTVNRYSRVVVLPDRIRVDYVVDMAEIPAFQAMSGIDTDGDGTATATELAAWATGQAIGFGSRLHVSVEGDPVALDAQGAAAQLLPGQGGLQTLRFEGTFAGAAPDTGALTFRDANFPGQIGWKEITAVGAEGAVLSGSTVPTLSVSDELRTYPEDLLSSPLDVATMEAAVAPGESGPAPAPITSDTATSVSSSRPQVEAGALGGVLNRHGFGWVLLGLAIAVAFGAWHAMLPGHGKTLMAAYMVGSTSRVRHAATVGTAVAVMHTASVLALGLLVLTLEQTFRPETLYPWLGLLSGLVALGLGAYLLISRLSAWGLRRRPAPAHDHAHDEANAGGLEHDHGLGRHTHALPEGAPLSPRGILALALAGGILPAPSALIVMLGAIEAHRAAYGVTLVLAFSAGLAAALMIVGMGAMKAREAMTRRLSSTAGRLVPVLSASAIVAVGVFLTARGISQV
jgi:nickel/cobalt exporter